MRYIMITAIIFVIAFVIKIDLTEGTLPIAAFDNPKAMQKCEKEYTIKTIPVITELGDSPQSLFAAYPSEIKVSVPERLAQFYQLNPHLQKQALLPGELIKIPVYVNVYNNCSKQ
ncbi:MAG TPA: hypothetical protein VNR38_04220 [Ureibacillus sp.]|nr:hypothetical protein [Ureibacillus sp.]